MSIIETKVTFANKHEEIQRVMRKSNKEQLAESLVSIRKFINDEDINLSPDAKLNSILRTIECLYW